MLQKIAKKTKCSMCGDVAEHSIVVQKPKRKIKINLCNYCLLNLYFDISKAVTPRSPRNIMNK